MIIIESKFVSGEFTLNTVLPRHKCIFEYSPIRKIIMVNIVTITILNKYVMVTLVYKILVVNSKT